MILKSFDCYRSQKFVAFGTWLVPIYKKDKMERANHSLGKSQKN